MEAIEGCVEQSRALDISISIRNVTTTHVAYNHADAVIRVLKGVLLCCTISRPTDNLIFDCFFDHSSPHLYFFITVHIRYIYIYFHYCYGRYCLFYKFKTDPNFYFNNRIGSHPNSVHSDCYTIVSVNREYGAEESRVKESTPLHNHEIEV